jgi:GT2 family glycosyltransferase
LSAAKGTILLMTDDDVIPSKDWVVRMTEPLFRGDYDAIVGRVELPAHLSRPWMTTKHEQWLSGTGRRPGEKLLLMGGNMGFHHRVLDRVPGFDAELGAGKALGNAEDMLFSWQLEEAGFRIGEAPEALVVHHLDASRLLRSSWLSAARARGRTEAYLLHHWEHAEIKWPWLRAQYLALKLHLRRLVQPPPPLDHEGVPLWEFSYVFHIEKYRQYNIERKRVRNYERRGLVKRSNSVIP